MTELIFEKRTDKPLAKLSKTKTNDPNLQKTKCNTLQHISMKFIKSLLYTLRTYILGLGR